MSPPFSVGHAFRSSRLRTWAVKVGIAILVLEALYVVAGNLFLRSELLPSLINKKPEKTHMSWESAFTFFPGLVRVNGFTLRSQTKRDQVWVSVAEADARISLWKLIFKTIHIRGVDGRNVDFRYRERVDSPRRSAAEGEELGPPPALEYYPEIPGFSNPPDPRPEDLYPTKKKKHPWTIRITGADVEGPVRVALNAFRLEGEGSVGGGVSVRPRETVTIHRGRLALASTTVFSGPDVVTDNSEINSDLRFEPFPAKGATFADVLGGISGTLAWAGDLSQRAARRHEVTPGISIYGAGTVAADLRFKKGVVRRGSTLSLKSDEYHVGIMGLDATGSATVSVETVREMGIHETRARVEFGAFEFVDPEDDSPDIVGTGLEMNARWADLSLGNYEPASYVELVLPTTEIRDVGAFDTLMPEQGNISIDTGTGTLKAYLEVNEERIATGKVDLVAKEIALDTGDAPLRGDVAVHAVLSEGDLRSRRFELTQTTIHVDNIVDEQLKERKREKLEAWHGTVTIDDGTVIFDKPTTADGHVRVEMYDTRPLVALLKGLGVKLGGLSMMPNVKDVDGSMRIDLGKQYTEVEDLELAGKDLEVLGWVHVRDKKADGRLFAKYGLVAAGIALDQGKAKVHLVKPRTWFEEQDPPPSRAR